MAPTKDQLSAAEVHLKAIGKIDSHRLERLQKMTSMKKGTEGFFFFFFETQREKRKKK